MKYPIGRSVGVIRVDQRVARRCYDERGCAPVSRRGLEENPSGPRAPPKDKIWSIPKATYRGTLIQILRENLDVFAWSPTDMPYIDPNFLCHRLSIATRRKRRLGEKKKRVVKAKTTKLLQAGFIQEVQYPTWLSNVVMVKKPSVIIKYECTPYNESKIAFMTDEGNFCYKVMPFGLKNEGATY
ncbi:hypothetical protein CR513_39365, partial [Mucuna pruriens]